MALIIQLSGLAIIALALLDIYRTVLSAGANRGPIECALSRSIWATFRFLGRKIGRQPTFAAACGPIIVASLLAAWSALLIFGFALIYWPLMGIDIQSSSHDSIQTFDFALYFSGFSLTTLGVGDVYAASGWSRILSTTEAWLGFSMISLTISYILSVYQAVREDNALATTLHVLSGGTGSSIELFKRLQNDADRGTIINELRMSFVQLYTAHHQYPVIHYFQRVEDKYSTIRMFFPALDYTSLRLAAGNGKAEASTKALWVTLLDTLTEFKSMILSSSTEGSEKTSPDPEAWHEHAKQLASSPPTNSTDAAIDLDSYSENRAKWDGQLHAIAEYFDVDWKRVITPRQA